MQHHWTDLSRLTKRRECESKFCSNILQFKFKFPIVFFIHNKRKHCVVLQRWSTCARCVGVGLLLLQSATTQPAAAAESAVTTAQAAESAESAATKPTATQPTSSWPATT
jgi:hypothetical protein